MIYLKSKDEIERIRESNQIVADALKHIKKFIVTGITTYEIDAEIEQYILNRKAKPSFKGLYGFPASTCISINDEVVHGIPSKKRKLNAGSIVGIDVGVELNGYYGDAAYTYAVEPLNVTIKKLLKVTEESLYLGIEQCRIGKRVGDISFAVQKHVEKNKFSVVRDMVGHGVGRKPHEEPQVPNFGRQNQGPRLKEGMVLAIEPMVNAGAYQVYIDKDKWTVKTVDGRPSAHFEHSVAITSNGPDILSIIDGE